MRWRRRILGKLVAPALRRTYTPRLEELEDRNLLAVMGPDALTFGSTVADSFTSTDDVHYYTVDLPSYGLVTV
ncbi:MAG: hypothetical protein AB7K24_06960, partial [Gemmataceae bacterium]